MVYEDPGVKKLAPVSTARPAFSITCACLRLSDWFGRIDGRLALAVRPHLTAVCQADFPDAFPELDNSYPTTIVIKARIVPTSDIFDQLDSLIDRVKSAPAMDSQVLAVDQADQWVVASIPTEMLSSFEAIDSLQIPGSENAPIKMETFVLPHDIIRLNQEYFCSNLEGLLRSGKYREIRDGVFTGRDVRLNEHVVFDTSGGPVVFDDDCQVGPFSFFEGPVYAGPSCKILEHASIKDCVCLTHTVKAGGEIEASVIEPFSNKQHHGFLGHSYLGSWINIGAGTCNSDLKNTYGKVNVQYPGGKVPSGLQFVGCFVGDYSKTAINTSIFTGKLIGVCSMLYGFVANNVPDFVNYAPTFGQITEIPAEVMITTQQRMFARRKIEHRQCDQDLIRAMHELTHSTRAGLSLSDQPPSF